MTLSTAFFSPALTGHPLVEKLGWVLLHFLWEGALVAGALALVLWLMRRRAAAERYAVSLAALALMAALPVLTWVVLPAVTPGAPKSASATSALPRAPIALPRAPIALQKAPVRSGGGQAATRLRGAAEAPPEASAQEVGTVAAWMRWGRRQAGQGAPLVALGWLAGVAVLALRTAGGWLLVRRMKRVAAPPGASWQRRFRRLAREMGLADVRCAPALLVSERARGPAAVGWWRPAVLVPAGFLTGLPPAQVEAILRHELAHVRRYDYLAGLAQAVVETLLFYHPAVWWVSGRVRTLREHCCDDRAARASSESGVSYARALAALADWRAETPALAPAASGGSLLARIRRVTGQEPAPRQRVGWPAAGAALAALGVLGACAAGSVAGTGEKDRPEPPTAEAPPPPAPSVRPAPPAPATPDTTPQGRVYTVRGDTVIANTVHAGAAFFDHDTNGDSLGARRFEMLRQRGFDAPAFDSLTAFTLRRADSTRHRADSVLSRFSVRLDSMKARFPGSEVFHSLWGGDTGGWTVVRPDTIPHTPQARWRALRERAGRLDARADTMDTRGRNEDARTLRERADRIRERVEEQREEMLEETTEEARQVLEDAKEQREDAGPLEQRREQLKEAREQIEQARERIERGREQLEEARRRMRQSREQMEKARERREQGQGGTGSGVRSGGLDDLNAQEQREIEEARVYVKGPVVRLDGRRLLDFENVSARGGGTLAFYHPEHGLFVFSDRPFEKAERAGQIDGRVARFTISGTEVEVRSRAERPLVRGGGERPAYVYHDPDYEPEPFGAAGDDYDGPWFGTGHVPGSDGGARAWTTDD